MNKKKTITISIVVVLVATICIFTLGTFGSYKKLDGTYKKATGQWSYSHLMNHPLLNGWGEDLFDWNNDVVETVIQPLNMNYVGLCMGVKTKMVNNGMNYLIDNANNNNYQYLNYYSDEEKSKDPSKEKTGLIYIPGDSDKPFAVVCAGGAFKAVAMLVEGFPVAKQISEAGYPVFLLKYRVSKEGNKDNQAYIDIINAMQYIMNNKDHLNIKNDDYSMWGFSAGGNLIYNYTEGDNYNFKDYSLKAPKMLALGYGAVWGSDPSSENFTIKNKEVKTYICYGINDGVIGNIGIDWAIKYEQYLKSIGSEVRFDLYNNAPHGFGDGTNTDAEGWISNALEFLEK